MRGNMNRRRHTAAWAAAFVLASAVSSLATAPAGLVITVEGVGPLTS